MTIKERARHYERWTRGLTIYLYMLAKSIHMNSDSDQTAFRLVYRADGQPWWNKPLTPHNTGPTLSPFVCLDNRP